MAHHFALRCVCFQRLIPSFHHLSLFKPQLFGSLLHLVERCFLQASCLSFQYLLSLPDALHVRFHRLFSHAWRRAVADMVFQTRFVLALSYSFFRDGHLAWSRPIGLLDEFQECVHAPEVAIWAVVDAEFLVDVSCAEDARKVFLCDADARIRLPVFQKDVVFRLVFLDETVFQQERIFFCVDDRVRDVLNLTDKDLCLISVYFFVKV